MGKHWTEEDQILALNLYHMLPFGRLSETTPEIKALANLMDRTPGSVSMKLCNFASLDPVIFESGRKGLANVSKKDREIWAWHLKYPDDFQTISQHLLDNISQDDVLSSDDINTQHALKNTEKLTLVKTRIGQSVFRKMVLENYGLQCCFSGTDIPQLLVASHIIPWAKNSEIRLNPKNGLCLSSIHDRAFDQGFWTINENFEIVISDILKASSSNFIEEQFLMYEGKKLKAPNFHLPEQDFFQFHRENIFR